MTSGMIKLVHCAIPNLFLMLGRGGTVLLAAMTEIGKHFDRTPLRCGVCCVCKIRSTPRNGYYVVRTKVETLRSQMFHFTSPRG